MDERCVTCYEITHDGEGEPGRSVEVLGDFPDAGRYAWEAAEYFDGCEMAEDRLSDSDLDGCSRVIEVRGCRDRSPARFRVWCRVRRHYEAAPVD